VLSQFPVPLFSIPNRIRTRPPQSAIWLSYHFANGRDLSSQVSKRSSCSTIRKHSLYALIISPFPQFVHCLVAEKMPQIKSIIPLLFHFLFNFAFSFRISTLFNFHDVNNCMKRKLRSTDCNYSFLGTFINFLIFVLGI
jgi:hypothetical protein